MTSSARGRLLDEAALVRGASKGFTVLVVGELAAPLVAGLGSTLGLLWLSLVGAAGFVTAGSSIGHARSCWLQGALAALTALSLTVPLRLLVGLDTAEQWYAVGISAGFGVVVGALAGLSAGNLRSRRGD